MATIQSYKAWKGGTWSAEYSSVANFNKASFSHIGKVSGEERVTIIEVSLGSLNGTNYQWTNLGINITIGQTGAYGSNGYKKETLRFEARSKGAGSSYSPQGTLYGYQDYVFTPPASSGGNSARGDVAINNKISLSLKDFTGNTIYIWIYSQNAYNGSNGWGTYKVSNASVSGANQELKYTAPTIKSFDVPSSKIYKPGETFTISWSGSDGVSNSITGYQVGVTYGSNSEIVSSEGMTTSKTITVSSSYRGQTIKVRVRALGTVAGFETGAYCESKTVGSVNNLPTKPTITNSPASTVLGSESVVFSLQSGTDSDSSQTYSIYYAIGEVIKPTIDNAHKVNGSLTLLGTEIGGGTHKIRFFGYDGLEPSSSYAQHTITVNLKPEITGNPTFTPDNYLGNNGAQNLTKSLSVEYNLASTETSPTLTLYYRQASTSSGASGATINTTTDISWDKTNNKITLTDAQLEKIITAGNYFTIGFKISNSSGDSETKWGDIYRRARTKRGVSSLTITPLNVLDESRRKANYFKNEIQIVVKNPSAGDGYADISSIQVYCGQKVLSGYTGSGNTSTLKFDFSSSIESSAEIKVILKDTLGRETTTYGATQYRAYNPTLDGATPSLDQTTIKPLSAIPNGEIVLSHPKGDATGSSSLVYNYKITVGTKESKAINPTNSTVEGNAIKVHFSESEVKRVLNLIFPEDPNSQFDNAFLTVTATDAFNDSIAKNSEAIIINYKEIPYFDTSSKTIEIGHDYYIDNINNWQNQTYSSLSSSSSLDLRMFNPGEGVIIKIPSVKDKNAGDRLEYRFSISRNRLESTNTVPTSASDSSLSYTSWFTLTQEQVEALPTSGNFKLYRYPASAYTSNQFFYFKLDIVDSTSQVVSCYSNTYIIGCRIAKPKINIVANPTVTQRTDSSTQKEMSTFTLNTSISILDLGGSALDSWNSNYYKGFKNLERSYSVGGTTFTKQLKIVLEVTTNLSSWNTNMKKEYICPSSTNFHEYSLNNETVQYEVEGNQKFYYRYKIYVRYGIKATNEWVYTEGDYQTYSYTGKVPTMAHRPNWIGINTATYTSDTNEAFVIEEYNSRNIVVFRSADGTKTIKFYLKDGTVEGNFKGVLTDMVIDGGTW